MVSKNYVVRVYRCEKNNPQNLVGVVEEVGVEDRRAFTNLDELWNILSFKNFRKEDGELMNLQREGR